MCNFVSWVEKNGKTYFLTGDQVFKNREGKALQKYCGAVDDLKGHGAIRHFYSLTGGANRECDDFSRPANFPAEIVDAIKMGKMGGFEAVLPRGLLTNTLYDRYEAERKPLYDCYEAERNTLDDRYQAERKPLDDRYWAERNTLDDRYEAERKPLDDCYEAERKTLYDCYEAERKPLYDRYQAERETLYDRYWALVVEVENRAAAWK